MACESLSSAQLWGSSGASIVPFFFFNPLKGQVVCFEKQQLLAAKSHCSLALLSTAVLHFPGKCGLCPGPELGTPSPPPSLAPRGRSPRDSVLP